MLQENILKEAPRLIESNRKLPNVCQRILHSKWKILRSPMSNEHPDVHYIEVKLYTNLNDSHCNSNSTNDHQVVLQ